jgi:hypothetical protein
VIDYFNGYYNFYEVCGYEILDIGIFRDIDIDDLILNIKKKLKC